jgi:hypothetical protein
MTVPPGACVCHLYVLRSAFLCCPWSLYAAEALIGELLTSITCRDREIEVRH